MTHILSLIYGVAIAIAIIYVVSPIIRWQKGAATIKSERELESQRKLLLDEIHRLNEDYMTGKIIKEDYEDLMRMLKEKFEKDFPDILKDLDI